MKIATQNIEFLFDEGIHAHSGKKWNYSKEFVDARVEYFAKRFSEIGADILLLQEIASETVIKRIIQKSGIEYSYFFATPDQNGVGNVVLYREMEARCESIPALSPLPVFVEGDPDILGSRIWSRRDFVYLQTMFDEKKLHIVGLHIKSNFLVPEKNIVGETLPMETQIVAADSLIRSEVFRFSQAKRVRELVDAILAADPDAHIVIGGDFNAEENYTVFRIIQGVLKDAPNTLIEAGLDIESGKRFSSLGTTMGRKRLLDHFLVSKSLEQRIHTVQILNETISAEKNVAPIPTLVGTDHAPIVIDLV